MASVNKTNKIPSEKTFEGGTASRITKFEELKRSCMSCLLWEDGFYEDGETIEKRIEDLAMAVTEEQLRTVLMEAKFQSKLRHLPLLLLCIMAKRKFLKKEDVEKICTRADDLTELLALYFKDGKKPLSKQLAKGLALAFLKFNEYALSKYNRDKAIKLRDVMRIVHPHPKDAEQSNLFARLLDGKLTTPDTWETELSAGKDKKETFERLITEKKLGDLAFVRNLRKMTEVNVDPTLIKDSFKNREWGWILPFQFVTSARYNPKFEPELESAMLKCLSGFEKISKSVNLLVDVSGSMDASISSKSETNRCDVASGLAILLREVCSDIDIYTFESRVATVPARHGFALRDAIGPTRGGTQMWEAIRTVGNKGHKNVMVIITDEQTSDNGGFKDANADLLVIINVASNKNGVGYSKNSIHINGWSENCVVWLTNYIKEWMN